MMSETSRGCVTLPLTVTRRCGKAIVEEAKQFVPEFEAHPNNPEGGIEDAEYKKYAASCQDGDFLLCRVNAPLISQCLKFIAAGRKANIQGRDVSKDLIRTLDYLWPHFGNVSQFIGKLSEWLDHELAKERAKRVPNEIRMQSLHDRHDCLTAFCGDSTSGTTKEEVIGRIEAVFTDDRSIEGIRLSSIHKAKGLEARRVYLLQPQGAAVPHPAAKTAWQQKQERNLLYVAITRAIETLVYVF